MAREAREVWEERVERWRTSGQSAREFAAAKGVNVWTLRKWSERLGREGAAGRSGAPGKSGGARRSGTARDVRRPAAAVQPLAFVEVLAGSSVSGSTPRAQYEIVLRSGVIVRVAAGFEREALEQVLAALESR
jgi:hypothetical protein